MYLLQIVNNNLKNPPNYADCPTLWVCKSGTFFNDRQITQAVKALACIAAKLLTRAQVPARSCRELDINSPSAQRLPKAFCGIRRFTGKSLSVCDWLNFQRVLWLLDMLYATIMQYSTRLKKINVQVAAHTKKNNSTLHSKRPKKLHLIRRFIVIYAFVL